MRIPRQKFRYWALAAAVTAALAVAWVSYSLRPSDVHDNRTPVASTSTGASDGLIYLDADQRRALDIQVVEALAAHAAPLPGLPAEILPSLSGSSQVTVHVAGVVTKVLVDEGQRVERGDALLWLQSRDLIVLEGELARARAEFTAARAQAQRDDLLAKEGIIPISRQIESSARAAAAEARLHEAAGMFSQLRRVPRGPPGEYAVLAPQAGTLLRRYVVPGAAVEPLAPMFVLGDAAWVDIQFHVPMSMRDDVHPGLVVELPGGLRADVVAVGADIDPATQSVRVRARVRGDTTLLVGRQLEVALLLAVPGDAIQVPLSALVPSREGEMLYVEEAGAFRGVVVQRLGGDASYAVVRGHGLAAGTRIVSKGAGVLKSLAPAAG